MAGLDSVVGVEYQDPIAIVTLNRPEALNALDARMRAGLAATMARLNAREDVGAIVIRGAGERAFCAGLDLKEARHVRPEEVEARYGEMRDMFQSIRLLDKPLVAALNGVAAGAGFQIGLLSDIRVGHEGTRMGQPEINAGLPSIMGSYLMTLHLGQARNLELSLTGRLMDAEEAARVGLLNSLTGRADLMHEALAIARDLASKAPTAVRWTKRRFRELTQAGFDDAARAAIAAQQEAYRNGDPQRIMEAFVAARGSGQRK
jgi:enoyl-CoA hydratase/carnithine racemase